MSEPSTAQRYQLILADIAMAAAIQTCGDAVEAGDSADYAPGAVRDRWLARRPEGALRKRVMAMANAGVASLQQLPPERLQDMAMRFGVPLDAELAATMAEHFAAKRDAWLRYNK
jgi:hypothetical protein